MTQEEKQLLLKDLCARLPYGVKVQMGGEICSLEELDRTETSCGIKHPDGHFSGHDIEDVKPYLRPMSSMTEEEEIYYNTVYTTLKFYEKEDWLLEHHFDYRVDPVTGKGMIDMGLAEEAPEGMYKMD